MSRVAEHLERLGVPFQVVPHAEAWTGMDEARALGVPADAVAKAVMVETDRGHVLCVVPSSRKLDMRRVREVLGDRHARLATEDEIQRDFPGYELGALPPLSLLLNVPVYIDRQVVAHPQVFFAGGSQRESVKIDTARLLDAEPATVADLTRPDLTRPDPT